MKTHDDVIKALMERPGVKAEVERVEAELAKSCADPDDAPELTDAYFEQADEFVGEQLVRRGRPKAE